MNNNELRILVVDDEPNLLRLVTAYLDQEGYQVKGVDAGLKALELFLSWKPHLVVLDLMLPDLSGEEICQRIRQQSDIPILMLTAKSGEQHLLEGFAIGADDYVTKPFSPKEVVARVRTLIRRSQSATLPQSDILSFDQGRLTIHVPKHQVCKDGVLVNLTPIEYKLLITLARHLGRTYSRAQLVEKAMGHDYQGYDRTIDAHIKNLRQKIEDQPKEPRYLLTVFGIGYKFGESE